MKNIFIFLYLFLPLVCVQAQSEEGRSRMVFPPGSSEPIATPAAAPEGTPALSTPEQTIDLFFLALQGDQVDAAYDDLVRGTIIADRREDVAALKVRTREAIDGYGPLKGYEVIDELRVGEHLERRTCLSLNTDLPLRWRFYFYLSEGRWRLVDLRVDDGLVELFEDSARRQE